ncbi:MAG TPA: ABC transporter permease [Polyangiales bacterium]|nr:ABC transporter permease [Polyangiales bacterium]
MTARFWLTLRRVLALSDKEVRHVLRDPRTLYLALGMPAVLLLLFGFGVSFDLEHMAIGFVDFDRTEVSRNLRARLSSGDLFDDTADFADGAAAERALVSGELLMVVVIERGFAENLATGRGAAVQLLIDGSDNSSAVQARSRAETALRTLGVSVNGRPAPRMASAMPYSARSFTRFNPEARSAVFLVPGITAYVLAIVAVLLTALTVAREWERGSMAQLFATPVGRLEIILGKLLPYLVLGALAVLLVTAVGGYVFDVPFRGSAATLTLLSLLFLIGMLGQGLLISVVTQNQMVATQVATMSSMLPSMLLSGFVFPIENMPTVLQWLSRVVPARYYVTGLRGVLLRGNGIAELWQEALLLAAFGVLMLGMATARFKRTLA